MGDTTLPDPGFPPFYSPEFFSKIRQVHQDSPLNVSHLTEKQWYQILMEENFMEESDRGVRQHIMCRVERASPGTDWENSWRLARLPGLGPDNISFLFKLMHEILPTQERVARTKPRASPSCTVVGCTVNVTEDLPHALILSNALNLEAQS